MLPSLCATSVTMAPGSSPRPVPCASADSSSTSSRSMVFSSSCGDAASTELRSHPASARSIDLAALVSPALGALGVGPLTAAALGHHVSGGAGGPGPSGAGASGAGGYSYSPHIQQL